MTSNINSLIEQARKLASQANYVLAIDFFNRVLKVDPKNATVLSERGIAFFHLKNKEQALTDLNKALELEPENPYRYSSRAFIKDSMGDTKGAVKDYQIAVKLDPDDAVAFNNLGLLEEKLGYKERSKHHFMKADELAEDFFQGKEKNPTNGESVSPKKEVQKIAPGPEVETEPESSSTLGEMKKVFTEKSAFKDFIQFIRRGFKTE